MVQRFHSSKGSRMCPAPSTHTHTHTHSSVPPSTFAPRPRPIGLCLCERRRLVNASVSHSTDEVKNNNKGFVEDGGRWGWGWGVEGVFTGATGVGMGGPLDANWQNKWLLLGLHGGKGLVTAMVPPLLSRFWMFHGCYSYKSPLLSTSPFLRQPWLGHAPLLLLSLLPPDATAFGQTL